MSSARAAEDPVFGDAALALAARSRDAVVRRPDSSECVHVEFDARGLAQRDRHVFAELERSGVAELHPAEGAQPASARPAEPRGAVDREHAEEVADRGSRRQSMICPRSVLLDARARTEAASVFLEAHDNARREHEAPRVMGIVNVTPDSFSASSRFPDPARAIDHGLKLVEEGATLIDIGGESSRPGASPIDARTELERVIPVVRGLARATSSPLSIDTTKAVVAEAALESGASIVNDISAGRFDPRMLELVAAHRAGFIAMHMQGEPRAMQAQPSYVDVLTEVAEFLRRRVRACLDADIDRSRIWIDPGIGFGKNLSHNLELIARLRELRSLGLSICLGVSRKSFISSVERRAGALPESSDAEQRTGGTAAASAIGVWNGASIVRVHDVRVMVQAVRVAEALARENRREPSADSCSSRRGAHNHDR